MSIENRKDARKALAVAITAGIPALQSVFPYLTKTFFGQSPVCTIESGPADYTSLPAEGNRFELIVGMWVNREDAATAEDLLDDLARGLAAVIDGWKTAEFTQPSMVDYVEMDDRTGQYRVEWHFVSVEWET